MVVAEVIIEIAFPHILRIICHIDIKYDRTNFPRKKKHSVKNQLLGIANSATY